MTTGACPYCRDVIAVESAARFCEGCGTPHHDDCYAENDGCTIFGCKFAPAEEPKLSITGPDLSSASEAVTPVAPVARSLPPPPPGGIGTASPLVAESAPPISAPGRFAPSLLGLGDDDPARALPPAYVRPPKKRTNYIVLGALLGAFGAHNFYAGYKKKAILQLGVTVLTLGFGSPMSWIWAVIDICTMDHDSRGIQFEA
jgi:hypothetical protein